MATIISESPDGKRQIVINPSSKTVCFIGCHIPSEQKWFSLRPRIHAEFTCPFGDILAIYTLPDTRANRVVLTPRHLNRIQIATAIGNAMFATDWTNSAEAREAITEISRTTPDPPALRNPNIAIFPFAIGCVAVAALLIAAYVWLTGE